MEKYYVEINNEEYEVLVRNESEVMTNNPVDETVQNSKNIQQTQQREPVQQKTTEVSTPNNNVAEVDEDLVSIKSPMSGTVLSIEASEGDNVTKDDVVIIIEAMKMETEIFAPVSGEIVEIKAIVGNHFKQGEELAAIKETGDN